MKTLTAFILSALLNLGSGQFQCPDIDDVCLIGNFPDPVHCYYFYQCSQNADFTCQTPAHIMCPDGRIYDWELEVCDDPDLANCLAVSESVVSAWRTTNLDAGADPVPFTTVGVNLGDSWSATTHSFTLASMNGVFYVSMDSAAATGKALDFVLNINGVSTASCSHTYTVTSNAETTGRDIVVPLKLNDSLSFSTTTGVYGGGTPYTNIGLFNIFDLMNATGTYFSVARDSIMVGDIDPVMFNVLLENSKGDFDEANNEFVVPSSGVYYFTFSTGTIGGATTELLMYVNDQLTDESRAGIIRQSTSREGNDVIGRSIMLDLQAGDTVRLVNRLDQTSWSSGTLETSFSGFKYEPTHNNMIAWSVARTTNSGAANPLPFGNVLVNLGSVFNTATNRVSVPVTGYYLIHMSVGARSQTQVQYRLYQGSTTITIVLRNSNLHNGVDTVSKTIIRRFVQGNSLSVRSHHNTYSDANMQTSFTGMLLAI